MWIDLNRAKGRNAATKNQYRWKQNSSFTPDLLVKLKYFNARTYTVQRLFIFFITYVYQFSMKLVYITDSISQYALDKTFTALLMTSKKLR